MVDKNDKTGSDSPPPKPVYTKTGDGLIEADFSQRDDLRHSPDQSGETAAFIPPINSESLERRIRERFGEDIDYDPKATIVRQRMHEALVGVACDENTHLSFPELAKEQRLGPTEIKRLFEVSAIQSRDDTKLPKLRYPLPTLQSFIGKAMMEQAGQPEFKPIDLVNLYFYDDALCGTTLIANLSFSHLETTTAHSTKFTNCSMVKAKLNHAYITDSTFENCRNMTYMLLTGGTELNDCEFKGICDLSYSTWRDVVLDNVTFSRSCKMRDMTFEDVTVRNMDFTKMTRQQKIAFCSPGIHFELESCKIPEDMYKVLVKKGRIEAPLMIEDQTQEEPMAIPDDGQVKKLDTGLVDPPNTVVHVGAEKFMPEHDAARAKRVAAGELNRLSNAESPDAKEKRDRAIEEGTVVDIKSRQK